MVVAPPALLLLVLVVTGASSQLVQKPRSESVVKQVTVLCQSNTILLTLDTGGPFSGMVYPRGLARNTTCLAEFMEEAGPVTYSLPLRACATMGVEREDGVEYYNTVVVQPHPRLVTSQGRGYHVRCRYHTKERTVTSGLNVSLGATTPLTATAPLPGSHLRIFSGPAADGRLADSVRIGDPLSLVVALDPQEVYGLKVTACVVQDGLGWGEQALIDADGCPVDPEILGPLQYSDSKTTAAVTFQAHKFPYTASVYYQCNVQLCIRGAGGCDNVPPVCGEDNNVRRRREAGEDEGGEDVTIEVFTGLFVNEDEDGGLREEEEEEVTVKEEPVSGGTLCLAPRTFAVGLAVAGVALMAAAAAAVAALVARRRRKQGPSPPSSTLSGPYTTTAYSHSS